MSLHDYRTMTDPEDKLYNGVNKQRWWVYLICGFVGIIIGLYWSYGGGW